MPKGLRQLSCSWHGALSVHGCMIKACSWYTATCHDMQWVIGLTAGLNSPFQPGLQGSAFYLSGAGLVIIGWTIIGLLIEAYGFWLLFCEFIPVVLQYSRRVPFLSKILDVPGLKMVSLIDINPASSNRSADHVASQQCL